MEQILNIVIECPHCHDSILIEQLNCKIFRHGVLKSTNQQINPHLSKLECDNLFENNLIYGCGKPFIIINDINEDNNYKVEICDYI
jgi:hypothetical protein